MSDAVTATGILVKRGTIVPPASVAITSNAISVAGAPTVVTTAAPHLLSNRDEVVIAGVTGSTPTINGQYEATVIDATHFSVPVVTTVAGSGGTVQSEFQTIAEITEVDPGGMSRNKIETSIHNEGRESHVLGILRQNDPTLKINYLGDKATHVALLADIVDNIKNNFKILFPSGISRTGPAYVQMFKFDPVPVDGKQGASLALTWAGPVAEDAG